MRAGKSVLHLDRHGHYGEHWGSFMHRELKNWMNGDPVESPNTLPSLSEHTITIPSTVTDPVSNLVEVVPPTPGTESLPSTTEHTSAKCNSAEASFPISTSDVKMENESNDPATADSNQGTSTTTSEDCSTSANEQSSSITDNDTPATDVITAAEDEATPTDEHGPPVRDQKPPPTVLSWELMEKQWRSFSFDIIPKVGSSLAVPMILPYVCILLYTGLYSGFSKLWACMLNNGVFTCIQSTCA